MALNDSKLEITDENATRVGVWIGSGIGGLETLETQHENFLNRGYKRVSPFFVPMMIPDMVAGQVSILLGAKGINSCTVTACATGTNSIGDAFKAIQRGDADVMITGGAEAPITKMSVAGFCANTALSTNPDPKTASRPFDANRDGFVIGEGAGVIILEDLEHALNRGAKIYAEIAGYGSTGDAFHITAPAPGGEGGARAMKIAIDDAGLKPEDIQYVNAHGTSTPYNDKYETMAVKEVFGDHAYKLALSSTKSMTGHMLGAQVESKQFSPFRQSETAFCHRLLILKHRILSVIWTMCQIKQGKVKLMRPSAIHLGLADITQLFFSKNINN